MTHRYAFDHKGKKTTCPACGHYGKFRRYIDVQTGDLLSDEYGICDRVNNCGYHVAPTSEGPIERRTMTPQPPRRSDWRCPQNVLDGCRDHKHNVFAKWLVSKLGVMGRDALRMYRVGTYPPSQRFPDLVGAMVFWQIGSDGRERSGKVIPYGPDGKRIKDQGAKWIHSLLYDQSMEALGIQQCLFGEHLLHERPYADVCVVESEKTAIIMSALYSDHVWVATGGSHGFSVERCMGLVGRKVWVFPDKGMLEEWKAKSIDIEILCESMAVSDVMEGMDVEMGDDIADHYEVMTQSMLFGEPVDPPKKEPVVVAQKEVFIESPVVRISKQPGVGLLIEELDLDMNTVTLKPYTPKPEENGNV